MPYASVIGPLAVEIETVRDGRNQPRALVQLPGYVASGQLDVNAAVPGGNLTVVFDGSTMFQITGLPIGTPPSAASAIQDKIDLLVAGATTSGLWDENGAPIVLDATDDAARLAELAQITCRWDAVSERVAITSGRRGLVSAAERSTVAVQAGAVADALGLSTATPVQGRLNHHALPVPRAMLVDTRVDFWADSQAQIAALTDAVTRLVPGRGSIVTLPALLARDHLVGTTTTLWLLPEGEPTTRRSLAHFEAGELSPPALVAPKDRVTGRGFGAHGAAASVVAGRVDLAAAAGLVEASTLSLLVSPTPLVPGPLDAASPAPRGVAAAIGVTIDPAGLVDGQHIGLLSLDLKSGSPALRIAIDVKPPAGGGGGLAAEIVASATFVSQGVPGAAEARWQVAPSALQGGATIHAAVDASTGLVEIFVDGIPAPKGAPGTQVTAGVGAFAIGYDLALTIGGAANPVVVGVGHAHVFSEPLGAFDVRLRRSPAAARQFAPGMRVKIAESDDGVRPGARRTEATIESVDAAAGALVISPPLEGVWPRARTLIFCEEYFVHQAALRRRDDLLNNLYRITVDYRVSALLEDDIVLGPQPAVETTETEIVAMGTAAPAARAPGTTADVV